MSNLQDDVRKFVLEIEESKNNGETLANLTKLQKETAKYRQENEELQKVMAHLDAKGQRNSKTYKEMEAKLKANKTAIRQNGVAMKGLEKNLDLVYMSSGQLKKRMRELQSALSTTSEKANPTEYKRLEDQIDQVGEAMGRLKGKSNQAQGFLGKMKGAAAGILPALGPAALVAGAAAAAKKIFDLSKQTMEYRQQMQKLTGESGQQLADLTAQVDASAKTFQKDFNELAVANHNFAESMGISEQASQKLIDKGFLAGADASDEFLDRLREYGPQFKAAGVDAETAIAIMTQEVKSGIYSDKGSDTIKEGTIRLREMSNATRDALNGIGISSTKLEADLKKGTISYFDAIQMVSDKLGDLPSQSSAVGTAIADIFGGAGEDAGLEYIKMLGTVETSMDKMVEGAGETAQAQQKLLDANNKLGKAWSDMLGTGTGTFTALKAGAKSLLADGLIGVTKGLASIRDWFVAIYNESLPVRAGLNYMFAMWKTGINLVKTQLQGLWEGLKLGGKLLQGILTWDKELIKEAFSDFKENVKTKAVENAKAVGNAWANAYNETLSGKMVPVKQVVETQNTTTNTTNTVKTSSGGDGYSSNDGLAQSLKIATEANNAYKDLVLENADIIDQAIRESSKNQSTSQARAAADAMRTSEAFTRFEQQQVRKREELYLSWALTVGQSFGQLMTDSEATYKDYLKQTILMALDALHQFFLIEKAKAIISGMAKGPFGILEAVGKVVAMELAYQAVRGVVAKNLYTGGFAGYTEPGGKYDKKQLVQLHGSEYVVPIEGTHNPSIKRVLDIMELARRNGTLSSINLPAAVSATSGGSSTQLVVLDSTDFDKAVTRLEKLKIPFSYDKFEKLEKEYKRQQQGSGM
ncbi:phage tail tape measure protein [uncultured Draconibacterium sp.]|uniref:phage tail tape measure protein n=1 Tax=uncultured Draconibacterium sp. TaxID=1573823 RepID=UPI0029C6B0B5|nr:phage tail tape measure protein [uncultured Draconibacterium sp.]